MILPFMLMSSLSSYHHISTVTINFNPKTIDQNRSSHCGNDVSGATCHFFGGILNKSDSASIIIIMIITSFGQL
jgi:hypothetical protein